MTESRFDIGMKVRKEVLGSEYVEQAQARTTGFDADFQRFITETAWGSLWARPDLDRRTRSLVTIAILAALGREELAVHLRASHTLGVDPHEIAEVLLHVAVYAGVPAANTAFSTAKHVFDQLARARSAKSCGGIVRSSHPICTRPINPRGGALRRFHSSRCH